MFEDGLVGLSVLGRRGIPGSLLVLGGLVGAQRREVAHDISVCAAATGSCETDAVVHGRVDESRVVMPSDDVAMMAVQIRSHWFIIVDSAV